MFKKAMEFIDENNIKSYRQFADVLAKADDNGLTAWFMGEGHEVIYEYFAMDTLKDIRIELVNIREGLKFRR